MQLLMSRVSKEVFEHFDKQNIRLRSPSKLFDTVLVFALSYDVDSSSKVVKANTLNALVCDIIRNVWDPDVSDYFSPFRQTDITHFYRQLMLS